MKGLRILLLILIITGGVWGSLRLARYSVGRYLKISREAPWTHQATTSQARKAEQPNWASTALSLGELTTASFTKPNTPLSIQKIIFSRPM